MNNTPSYRKNHLRICFWNCRSVVEKKDELQDFIYQENVDVMLLQETWLQPNQRFYIANYQIYRTDRLTHRGGGTAILVRKELQHKRHDMIVPVGTEATAVIITTANMGRLCIATCYNPPNNRITDDLMNAFHPTLPTIVAGDLNAKHYTWHSRNSNENGKALHKLAIEHHFCVDAPDTFTYCPTQVTGDGDVLDTACLMRINLHYTLQVKHSLYSDHWPVLLDIYNIPLAMVHHTNTRTNWDKFRELLDAGMDITHSHIMTSPQDIDREVDATTRSIQDAYKAATSTRPIDKNPYLLPYHIKDTIRKRNRCRKLWQQTRHHSYLLNYKELAQRVKAEIREHREKSWNSHIASLNPQDRSLWQHIKKLLNKRSQYPEIWVNGAVYREDEDKARAFAESYEHQFCPNDDNINDTHKEITRFVHHHLNPHSYDYDNSAPLASPREIKEIIKSLKPNKAPGHDQIRNSTLRNLSGNAIRKLTNIFNSCTRIGHFPSTWKTATIRPIPKPGTDHKLPGNYRPIALLPGLAKIYEKFLQRHLVHQIEERNILQPEQFGFRARHSTTQQLMRVVEQILEGFNKGQKTAAIFIDTEKAFDKIWLEGLLFKCIKYNLSPWLLHIIRSFVMNRNFQVQVNSAVSACYPVRAGVPQGSVLGPILFSVYMSDLRIGGYNKMALYADDAMFYATSKVNTHLYNKMNQITPVVEKWYTDWRLRLNVSKTKAMIFHTKGIRLPKENLRLYGKEISWVQSHTYLGVMLDQKLEFKKHISQKLKKAKQARGALNPLINSNSKLPLSSKLLIVNQLILPIILYACNIWNIAHEDTLAKIQKFFNTTLRIISGAPRWTLEGTLLSELNQDSIATRIYELTSKFYEGLESHPNPMIHSAVQYDLKRNRYRDRLRDMLLKQPP